MWRPLTLGIAVLCLFPLAANAGASLPAPRVSILTFDPGADLFAAFGHIAAVVQVGDRPAKVYNFGNYDFAHPNAKWRYAKGELDYWVSVSTLPSTLSHYRHFDRGTVLRELDLSSTQAARFVEALERATLPENRTYRYHHTRNNCCTRLRDLIDVATEGSLRRFASARASATQRAWLRRLMTEHALWRALLDYGWGPTIDRPISRYEEQFLPAVLAADLDAVRLEHGRPLVARKEQLLPVRAPSAETDPLLWLLPSVSVSICLWCLALFVARRRPWATRALGLSLVLWGLVSGLLGAVLVFLQAGAHTDAHGNANHLLTPVTNLWLIWPGFLLAARGKLGSNLARGLRVYLGLTVGALGIALLLSFGYQDNLRFVGLLAGPILAMAGSVYLAGACRLALEPVDRHVHQ